MKEITVPISNYIEKLSLCKTNEEFSQNLKDVFLSISNSLITGEYIDNDLNDEVNFQKVDANKVFKSIEELEVGIDDLKSFIFFLSDIIPFIENLKMLLRNRLEMQNIQLFTYFDLGKYSEFNDELNLLYISIWLTVVDLEFHFSEELKKNLFDIKQYLNLTNLHKDKVRIKDSIITVSPISNDSIKRRLYYKSNFLLNKIHYRGKLIHRGREFYLLDLSLAIEDAIKPEKEYFQVFEDYINSYYFSQNNILNEGNEINFEALNFPLNLFEFHNTIYYLKEINKSSSRLIQLYNKQFVSKFEIEISKMNEFDKMANQLSQVYCLNNILSLLIKETIYSSDFKKNYLKINKFYLIIEKLQEKVSTFNYFCHLRYLDFLISYLEQLLKQKEFEESESLLSEIDYVNSKYVENFSKCKELNYFHFHLDKEYSTTNVLGEFAKSSEKDVIFSFSSFVIPFSYEDDDKINEFELKILNAKIQAISEKNLNNAESLQNKLKEQIVSDFDKNKFRIIEILSIFSAIVVFASGGIQILNKANDVYFASYILLIFGVIMLLFVNSTFLLVRNHSKLSEKGNKKNIDMNVVFIIILSVLSYILTIPIIIQLFGK